MSRAHLVLTLTLLAVACLIGCSKDPHHLRITEQNQDTFIKELEDSEGLTVEEARLLLAYELRRELRSSLGAEKPQIVGKTVGDLIEEQRAFEADAKLREREQERLAVEERAKAEALAAELRKAIGLTVYEKSFLPSSARDGRYDDFIVIKVSYQNQSEKEIRAFTGSVRFTDLFGRSIYEAGITISDPVQAGKKGTWVGSIEYNQFVDELRALKNTSLDDMKTVWLPTSILFGDGTMIGETTE